MENKNSSNKDLSKRTVDEKNTIEAERSSLAGSKIFMIETISEEEKLSTKSTNSFQKEAMKESNGILKESVASESFSKKVNDPENRNKSVRECKEDAVAKITIADELNGTLLEKFQSDGSKREMKNPRKIGDMATTDKHRCQHPLRDIIGKREQRRDELDKMEGDLRQRLDMLECSIPAVMVWNIWRMSQGAPVCRIKRILEKQFKDTRELSCRSTPSCHYDCRIREVEAERKLALKKMEEARTLWSEKLTTLEERKRKLDEAKRIQEEQKNAIERLNEETRALRETMEKKMMKMDELCQCDDVQCKQRHLDKVSSVTSVESGDIQFLEKLQRLAEEEVITKREIAELERREEAYMRTLQQADEMWSKMEGDMISTTDGLQEQLDMKTAANQQLANRVCELEDALEKCQAKLAACRAELEKFRDIEKVEAMVGRDDDVAKVVDREVAVKAKVVHRPIGRIDDVATVKDGEVLARTEVADEETLAKIEVADGEALARVEVEEEEALARVVLTDADVETVLVGDDKFISVKPDLVDLAVDRPIDLVQIEDVESVVKPEDIAYDQQRFKEVREYLSKLDSLEDLYRDDGEPCAPDFVCNDVVSSPTGMTDEELITLGVKHAVPTKEYEIINDEQEKQFQEKLERKADVDDIEKKEKKDEIFGVEIERKVVEKMEKQVAEIVDVPVRETVTLRTIEEEAANDRPVTMPKHRVPEVNKIEADRGVMIQRDTILSWIDAIDTIRTTAAKHPDCHEVKKDADVLAEQVGTYVGIKPKEVKEENATTVTEETSAEVKAELELLPTLTEKEVPIDVEPTAVSIEDSFQFPTIHTKKDLKDDTVLLTIPGPVKLDNEKIRAEETRIKDIVQITKEIKTSKNNNAERNATVKDLTNNKLAVNLVANDKTVNSDKEETLVVSEMEKKEEVISNHIERNEKKEKDIPTEIKKEEIIVESKKIEVVPVTEIKENGLVEEVVEKFKEIPQLDETKMTDIKETMIPHMEIIRPNEIVEVPKMEEVEQEKPILAIDVTEEKEIIPGTISPTVDIIEIEKFEPDKFPIVDVEKVPIVDAVEEKIEIEEPVLIKEEVKAAEETPLIMDIIKKEEIEVTESPIEDIEKKEDIETVTLPPITDIAKEEKIEAVTLPLITDIVKEEKIEEAEKLPPMAETIEKEKIEAEKLSLADVVTEEKIEIIQPIKREIEEEIEIARESPLKIEIKNEKDKEIEKVILPEEVTAIELPEKKKEEEIPAIEEKKILMEIPPPKKPTLKDEKEVPVEEEKPEVQAELKIPIAEIMSTEMEMPTIPLDSQLMAQPYLIIARLKETELLKIIPVKQPCTCLQPLIETAKPFDIPQTDILSTEIVQTEVTQAGIVQIEMMQTKNVQNEVMQTEIVQTEAVETEIVQITTQAVSTAEPPRTPPRRIISEYLKPVELKASRTEIASDHPEITGRKMLWRKRLKDQSTVTTASIGSQTDKTSHVSHDRVVRDERERARVPTDELLRSIKIAAGLVRPDTEREIRTINYGGRSEEMGRVVCNCCLCGRTPTSPSTGPRLEIQPQIDAKTATPPAVAAFKRMFIRPKIDHPIPHDRLCPDCKAKIQSRMSRERHHVEKIIKKIPRDQEGCCCTSLIDKPCRAVPRKRVIEKRDQASLAKIPKRKTNPAEQKRKNDMQSILENPEELTVQPLSPSCICYKLEKTGVEPIKKGNCYCAD